MVWGSLEVFWGGLGWFGVFPRTVVAAIDSEYFAIIFAKRDRCCRGRHL